MYYDEHTDYLEKYIPGVRKLCFRTKQPRITKNMELQFRSSWKNYDLLFAKDGRLTNSIIYRYRENKISDIIRNTYAYSKAGQILMILSSDHTNTLKTQIQFDYDEEGLIEREYVIHYTSYNDRLYDQEILHSYSKGYHKIEYEEEGLDDDIQCVSEEWFNENGEVIERKFWSSEAGVHIWERYLLNDQGEVLKEFDVNEDGSFVECERKDYKWETFVEKDRAKGITTTNSLRDGELMWIEEKKEEYY